VECKLVFAHNQCGADEQTVDRILDAMLLPPPPKAKKNARENLSRNKRTSSELTNTPDYGDATETMVDGIEPSADDQMNIDDWEEASGRDLNEDDVDEVAKLVTWYYVKWDDLQYDQCQSAFPHSRRKADI
jgi:hypothetical protein